MTNVAARAWNELSKRLNKESRRHMDAQGYNNNNNNNNNRRNTSWPTNSPQFSPPPPHGCRTYDGDVVRPHRANQGDDKREDKHGHRETVQLGMVLVRKGVVKNGPVHKQRQKVEPFFLGGRGKGCFT